MNSFIITEAGIILFVRHICSIAFDRFDGTYAIMKNGIRCKICNRDACRRIAQELQNGAAWFDFSNGRCKFGIEKGDDYEEI